MADIRLIPLDHVTFVFILAIQLNKDLYISFILLTKLFSEIVIGDNQQILQDF